MGEAAAAEFPLHRLAALAAKRQDDRVALDLDIRFQERRSAARSVCAEICLAARTDGAARHQMNDCRQHEFARRLAIGEMLADAAADVAQGLDRSDEAPCLSAPVHVL